MIPLHFVEIVWADHRTTRLIVSSEQLGGSFEDWRGVFLAKAGQRPCWVQLGDLTFYSQNVISIELIETIDQEV